MGTDRAGPKPTPKLKTLSKPAQATFGWYQAPLLMCPTHHPEMTEVCVCVGGAPKQLRPELTEAQGLFRGSKAQEPKTSRNPAGFRLMSVPILIDNPNFMVISLFYSMLVECLPIFSC